MISKRAAGMKDDIGEALRDTTFARLVACYGHDRASLIMDGKDPQTQRDIQAWRDLGRSK